MHINQFDLNLFVAFAAIYAAGSITRASEQLNLSQPAVSHALGRLRARLDDPLFSREGRRMVPTPLARSMIGPVRRALRGLEITLNEAARFDPATVQRAFTVGTRGVAESTALPALVAALARSAPGVDLSTVSFERRQLESELAAGSLDAALDVLLPVSRELRHQRIGHDRLVVMLRDAHPLLAREFDLAQYLAAEHVLVSGRRSGGAMEDLALSRHGLQRRVRLRCQQHFAACQVIECSDLLLTLPARYARLAGELFGVRVLAFPLDAPSLDIYLYWHGSVDTDPANRWLRERLIEVVADSATASAVANPLVVMRTGR